MSATKDVVDVPANFVLPAALLRELHSAHPPPPLPVYAVLMKDLTIGLYETGGPLEFLVPAFVHGYPLYDAESAARWISGTLLHAGYDAFVIGREVDPNARDMWPDRTATSAHAPFPYDAAEYDAAMRAPAFTIVVG